MSEVNGTAIEVEGLKVSGSTANDLNRSSCIDVSGEVEDLALLLSSADEVASLDDDIGCAIVGARTSGRNPEVVCLITVY